MTSPISKYLYYDHDGITIYCGDCREILPHLGPVDLVLTDPPYGVDFKGKCTKHTTRRNDGYTTQDDGELGSDVVRICIDMTNRCIVFPGTRKMFTYPPPDDIGCIYCPSGAGIGRWGFTCFHPVLFYGKRPTSALYPSSMQSFHTAHRNGHPCPKPIEWLKWALKIGSTEKDLILDPFMGSGTTLVAAKQLRRKAIGIEIEEKYCAIAKRRLAQGVLDF